MPRTRTLGTLALFGLTAFSMLRCNIDTSAIAKAIADAGVTASVQFEMHLERFDAATGTFEVLTPPPTKRNLFGVENAAGKVLVVGGVNEQGNYLTNVDVYDPTTKAWTAGAPWTRPHLAYRAKVGDLVCFFGGAQGADQRISRDNDCYDASKNEWSQRAPVPDDVGGGVYPAVYDGKIYVLGGTKFDSKSIVMPLSTAYAYDPKADAWTKLPEPPEARGGAGVVPFGDKLYVIAGFGKPQSNKELPPDGDMLVFEPKAGTWARAAQMPGRGIGFGLDALSTGVAAYFGIISPTLHRYDIPSNTWIAGKEPAKPFDAGVYTSLVHNGDLYLLVLVDKLKSRSTESSGKLWKYDAKGNTWAIVGSRSPETRDALFFGTGIGESVYFAGVFTTVNIKQNTPSGSDAGR